MEFIYWLLIGLYLGGCIGFIVGLKQSDEQVKNIFNAWSKSNEDWKNLLEYSNQSWKQLLDKIKANYEKEIEELKK